ncbi:MAG: Stk1 family PASTA domain-containing Ser/Thr kinase [Ruminococcus sp.]|nr:Stk1 family PASTA domain-containing Ser/Thr kinase [Ruminococcus sp.]
MDKYIGKKLDGRYEIHELIGVGGMANVYRCTDTIDDREVAVKILKDEYLNNEEFIRRFKNESKAIAMLSHPNIVKVYDVSFGDMIQYIVMEYIDGITLKEYIEMQGVLSWKEVVHFTTQILKALQHAHEKGIVHRDIKPQNIMLLQNGTIKVTDFGIARFSDKATRTMTEQAIGSVHYIAPEQARGASTDGKSDIYSVGVMLYEMLTGRLPFEADSAVSVALMQLQSTPTMPRVINPAIPQGLEQITMKAMQKDPINRYQSAVELLTDLERFRLNPSVTFDYNYFVDNQPTRAVGDLRATIRRTPKSQERRTADRLKSKEDYNDDFNRKKAPSGDTGAIDDFEDDNIKNHKPAYYAVKGALISAVAVAVIVLLLCVFRACSTAQVSDVDVPEFVGKTIVEVQENNPNKFNFEIKTEYDQSQEIGLILQQDPEPNSMKVKQGATITLTVNGTDANVTAPFVLNNSEEDAIRLIREKNLVPQIVYVENELTPEGYVANVFPNAGTQLTIGSNVYVYVASGPRDKRVTVPDVTGLTLTAAQEKLEGLGLTVDTTYDESSKEPRDTILTQSPLQYGKVTIGTKINLVASAGKEDKKRVTIYVDLPADATGEINMSVLVDGVVNTTYSKNVYPEYSNTTTLEFEGTGTSHIVVQLDGNIYREYNIDYSTGNVETTTYDYIAPTTEPVVTEPETGDPYTEDPMNNPDLDTENPTDDDTSLN